MAKTGTLYGSYTNGWRLKLGYSYTQDVSTNQTTIVYSLYVYNGSAGKSSKADYKISNMAKPVQYSMNYSSTADWQFLGTSTKRVTQLGGDSASIFVSATWNSNITSSTVPATLSVGGIVSLQEIPKSSFIKSISTTSPTIGQSISMEIETRAETYYHKLYYSLNGGVNKTTIATLGTATSYVYSPSADSLYKLCPNSQYLTMDLYLGTYTDNTYSTRIGGFQIKQIIWGVDKEIAKPDVLFTMEEVNNTIKALTGGDYLIQGYSDIKFSISGTAKYYATITRTEININFKSYLDTPSVTIEKFNEEIESFGDFKPLYGQVYDSRGLADKAWFSSLPTINYKKPSIALNATLVVDSTDETKCAANLTLSGSAFIGSFGTANNAPKVYYRYRTSSGSYSAWQGETNVTDAKYNIVKTIGNLSQTTTYYIQAKVADNLENEILSDEVKVKFTPVFDFDNDDMNINVPLTVMGNPIEMACFLYGAEKVPSSANLNNYTTAGTYYIDTGSDASAIGNCPVKYGGILIVLKLGYKNTSYVRQFYYPRVSDCSYYMRYKGASDFGNWYKFTGAKVETTTT